MMNSVSCSRGGAGVPGSLYLSRCLCLCMCYEWVPPPPYAVNNAELKNDLMEPSGGDAGFITLNASR